VADELGLAFALHAARMSDLPVQHPTSISKASPATRTSLGMKSLINFCSVAACMHARMDQAEHMQATGKASDSWLSP
jgi:hypothetical protein